MEAPDDDIFDENATEVMIGSRDWKKMESSLTKLGYRDGIAEGQEINVQEGFNQGYKAAASLVFSIAVLRGEISAILSMKHIQKTDMDKSMEAELEKLLQEVRDLEQSCMKTSMEAQVQQAKQNSQYEALCGTEVNSVTETQSDTELNSGVSETQNETEVNRVTVAHSDTEDNRVTEVKEDSSQKGNCGDCKCNKEASLDQECGQNYNVQSHLVQSDIHGQLSASLLDTKTMLEKLYGRLKDVMESQVK
ncbi:protein YAE1 homolog [Ylistrum balloti]|uniref:protein YAE1 homolog n=1 Tax=Ylistrum balloti TaxID=509963 RepID=UPI002905CC2E|nr:protein YAE1 homolog [Ylistrum balloti]